MPISRRQFAAMTLGSASLAATGLAASARAQVEVSVHALTDDVALDMAVNRMQRTPENRARDVYRHPVEALTFWGLKTGDTVVEIDPGAKGYWLEILAPYARLGGGTYLASLPVLDAPGMSDDARARAAASHKAFQDEIAAVSNYSDAKGFEFGPAKLDALPAGTADFLLVARAFHNWSRAGTTEPYMAAFHRMLKPGGIFAVEQHRAPEGSDPMAGTGYVPESYVIDSAKKAGFTLEARSEINANPKDTRDHPFGVWTLPPVRQSSENGRTLTPDERAKYDAIGESDRMTLRFRKA